MAHEKKQSVRSAQKALEQKHGHCADFLMNEYGVPKLQRAGVLNEIDAIYDQGQMFHDIIIHGVRGYVRTSRTAQLKSFLEQHATKKPQYNKQPL
jgi:hypothetical protein